MHGWYLDSAGKLPYRGQDFTPPIHTHVRCDDFTCFAYHVVQQLLLSQSFLPQWK